MPNSIYTHWFYKRLGMVCDIRYQAILSSVYPENSVFWVTMPCSSEIGRRFGRTYGLNLEGRRWNQARNNQKAAEICRWFLDRHRLLFDHKDGGGIFVRYARLSPSYMTLQPRRPFFSLSPVSEPQIQKRKLWSSFSPLTKWRLL